MWHFPLPELDVAAFNDAIESGVLVREETDDMRFVYALNIERIHLRLRTRCANPTSFVRTVARSEQSLAVSKVGLMLSLLDRGWSHQDALAPHLSADVEPHFSVSAISRSKWFWWALVNAEEVFSKLASVGLDRIDLHMPGGLVL